MSFCSAVILHLQKNFEESPASGHSFPIVSPHAILSHKPAASEQTRELALVWYQQPPSGLWITMFGPLTVPLPSRIQAHTQMSRLGRCPGICLLNKVAITTTSNRGWLPESFGPLCVLLRRAGQSLQCLPCCTDQDAEAKQFHKLAYGSENLKEEAGD